MKILLADDHPLFREGVKPVLFKLDRRVSLIEAHDYPSAFKAMHKAKEVDLALLDLYMPGMAGLDGVTRFRAAFPDIPVVVLSASEQVEDIQKLLASGALGYITKASPSDVILEALQQVLAGGIYVPPSLIELPSEAEKSAKPLASHPALTARQLEVLREMAKGLSNRQIGEVLQVTEGTVKLHVTSIFRLLRVNNRTEAVLVIQKMGLHKLKK
jgi:DNA-binding NarL/FixJ family response regulator